MRGRRRGSIARAIQSSVGNMQTRVLTVDWVKVFKASFMLLFVAYPGKSDWGSGRLRPRPRQQPLCRECCVGILCGTPCGGACAH